jgi:hypothetical protein
LAEERLYALHLAGTGHFRRTEETMIRRFGLIAACLAVAGAAFADTGAGWVPVPSNRATFHFQYDDATGGTLSWRDRAAGLAVEAALVKVRDTHYPYATYATYLGPYQDQAGTHGWYRFQVADFPAPSPGQNDYVNLMLFPSEADARAFDEASGPYQYSYIGSGYLGGGNLIID